MFEAIVIGLELVILVVLVSAGKRGRDSVRDIVRDIERYMELNTEALENIYVAIWSKPKAKKRGRPKGSKNKTK